LKRRADLQPSLRAIQTRLKKFRLRWKWRQSQPFWISTIALLPAILLGFLVAEHFGDHESASRLILQASAKWTLLWVSALALMPLLWFHVVRRHEPELDEMAKRAGLASERLGDRLLDAFQILRRSEVSGSNFDPDLVDAAFAQADHEFQCTDLKKALPKAMRLRTMRWASFLVVSTLILFLLGGSSSRLAFNRLMHPEQDFRGAPQHELQIEFSARPLEHAPDSLDCLLEGQVLDFEIYFSPIDSLGTKPPAFSQSGSNAFVRVSIQDASGTQELQLPLHSGRAHYRGAQPRGFVRALASIDERVLDRVRTLQSDTLFQEILSLPALDHCKIRIAPLSYTGLSAHNLKQGIRQIECPEGSHLQIQAKASISLQEARLCFLPDPDPRSRDAAAQARVFSWPLQIDADDSTSRAFGAAFTAKRSGAWWFQLTSQEGLPGRSLKYHLTVLPDEAPALRVLLPATTEGVLDQKQSLELALLAEDDFGFSALQLVAKRLSPLMRDVFQMPDLQSLSAAPAGWTSLDLDLRLLEKGRAIHESAWALNSFELLPDDELLFFFLLADNNAYKGAQTVRSDLYRFKMPGLKELFAENEKTQEDLAKAAEDLVQETRESQKELKKLREELKRGEELTWQRQQKLKQIAKQQEALTERSQEMVKKLEKLEQQMENQQLVSDELLKKVSRLKELLQKAIDPAMLEKLKELSRMAPKNPKQAPKLMSDMQDLLEQMEQQLDRFLQVLEQMQVEMRLEELAKRAQDLLEQQRVLSEKTPPSGSKEEHLQETAQEQKEMAQTSESLEEDIARAIDDLSERADFPAKSMEKIAKGLAEKPPAEQMQQMSQQMQSGQSPSQSQQMDLDMQLNQLAEDLQSALEESREMAMEELSARIDRLCLQLLLLSRAQEQQSGELKNLSRSSARLPRLALACHDSRMGVVLASNEVDELIRQSFHLSPAVLVTLGTSLRHLDEMLECFHERRTGKLLRLSPMAMGRMNQAFLQLKQAKQQMEQSKSSSGFDQMMEKLSQASKQQQCLNGQCSKLMCAKPGESQKPLSISFGSAKSEQGSIRESLEEAGEKQGEDGQPQLGDMGKVASDMREAEKDLESKIYTERTKRLQERILTRLLDAQRSLRRQDESKKRESRRAQSQPALNPETLLSVHSQALRRALEESLRVAWTAESEALIRAYFRQLEEESKTQE
jgi:hypothetical protein